MRQRTAAGVTQVINGQRQRVCSREFGVRSIGQGRQGIVQVGDLTRDRHRGAAICTTRDGQTGHCTERDDPVVDRQCDFHTVRTGINIRNADTYQYQWRRIFIEAIAEIAGQQVAHAGT